MKKMALSILTSTLILTASSMTLAAMGPVPKCTSGAVNIEIYNKDLDTCADDGKSKYCLYDLEVKSNDHNYNDCTDHTLTIIKNLNESHSLTHRSSRLEIHHYFYKKGGPRMADFYVIYDNGSFTSNCSSLFGADTNCTITKSDTAGHQNYKLTISKK